MKLQELINEDDYWEDQPDRIAARQQQEDARREEDLEQFAAEFADNQIGTPPGQSMTTRYGNVRISVPRRKDMGRGGRGLEAAKAEWRQIGEELIDELRINDFGNYEITTSGEYHVEVTKEDVDQ